MKFFINFLSKVFIILIIFVIFGNAQDNNTSDTNIESQINYTNTNSTEINGSNYDPYIDVDVTDKPNDKPFEDILIVEIYNSTLTKEEREEYFYWVKFKNSFQTNVATLAKMTKYFAPEDPTYFDQVYMSGLIFYILASVFGLCLLIYLPMRFIFGWFQGPKQHVTKWFGFCTYSLVCNYKIILINLVIGFVVCLIFFGLSLFKNSKVYHAVSDVSKFTKNQSNLMRDTAMRMEKDQILLQEQNYTTEISEFTDEIYKFTEIQNETFEYSDKISDFADYLYNEESSRFSYEIAFIVIISILTIGILILFKFKKSNFILFLSLILFTFIIPSYIIMGMNTSSFILSIDLCKDVNKYILSKVSPYSERGLGVYVSCPSKPTQVMINTARYELGMSFNRIIEEINGTLIKEHNDTVGVYRRNNSHFKEMAEGKYNNQTNIKNGLYSLYYTNNILLGLSQLSQCQGAFSIINYIEENFCYENVTYRFDNMFYYFFGIAGLLLLAIGTNKMTVLLTPAYQKLDKNEMELLNDE